MGLRGVIRGKAARPTISDKAAACPLDRVNRRFRAPAPNMLWLSDFTYVSTWQGFAYVAFVIDAFARADFVLDAGSRYRQLWPAARQAVVSPRSSGPRGVRVKRRNSTVAGRSDGHLRLHPQRF